ncbi:MAG: SIS domain-containing protein [Deltaproteobacteria bacterium]|jgi:D-sedoheptulose 7-phosphate isomerase|nr:SIS domain-containing protein [Deltaproteobacteria bacterium]
MQKHLAELLQRIPCLFPLKEALEKALALLLACARSGGKILICGNGGSAADAEHIAGELMKGFLLPRPLPQSAQEALRAVCPEYGPLLAARLQSGIAAVSMVSGVALPTAFANDVGPELCFAQQVTALGRPGDIVWGISTSGNSTNVNHALRTAKALGLSTLGLTGRDGGAMAALCEVELRIPADKTPLIQELHLPVYHALCAALEEELFSVYQG